MHKLFFSFQILLLPFFFALPGAFSSLHEKDTCDLPAPASTNGQMIDATRGQLTWSGVSGAVAYQLVVTDNGSPFLQTTVSGTSYVLSGLTIGHTYHYTVGGMCSGSQTSSYIIGNDMVP